MMQITRKWVKKIHASYTMEGMVLENVESVKYLGVAIANDLQWNTRQQYSHLASRDEIFTLVHKR